jgi:uncharacterized protein YqeY
MALKQRIQDDLKAALLGGDRFVGETLRGLKAAILNEEVAQNKRDEGLDDATIEQIIAREVKKRHESARLYADNGREESAADEKREAEVLQAYLPAQLTEEQLRAIVEAAVKQLGANGMSDMGKVIGVVKSKVGNTADGAAIARIVKEELSR